MQIRCVVNCQEHLSLVCSRLCPPWRIYECVNCGMFTHATNAEQPDDDKVLVNSTLTVRMSFVLVVLALMTYLNICFILSLTCLQTVIVSKVTYNVSSGTLNPTILFTNC